jgi:uncharacterized protein with von Willebrand factor type A (vWA) domain
MTDPERFKRLGDELAAALAGDLNDTPVETGDDIIEEAVVETPPSPTALKLDRWSMRRGKEWLKARRDINYDQAEIDAASDFLAAAWEPSPQLVEKCTDDRRHHFLGMLMQTPEYQSLHRQTRLDDIASEMAAASYEQQYVQMIKQDEPEDELDRDAQALQAASKAVSQASEEVSELNDARSAMGMGTGGQGAAATDITKVRNLFKRIRGNHQLAQIMKLAGKYRRLAQSLQIHKHVHGVDEVVGIEYGDDLSLVVPSELALLADDDTELDFLRRFAEGELQIEELTATESEQKGPIVVVVDESGSMNGDRVANAKAMALAMAWIARHQKRFIALVGFSGSEQGNYLVIPPGTSDEAALLAWLEHFFGCGTDMDVPLEELPKKWASLGCPRGKTDLIMITDAICRVPPNIEKSFMEWKAAEHVKLDTIVIEASAGDLARVSDKVHPVKHLGLDSECVAECLSL